MGSRAVVLLTRDDDVAASVSACWARRCPHADRSILLPPCINGRPAAPSPIRRREGRPVRGAGHALAAARCRTAAMERQGRRPAPHPYAAVGAAARSSLPAATAALESAVAAGLDVGELLVRTRRRTENAEKFSVAYRRCCCPTDGLDGVRMAPFQLLASEGSTYQGKPHAWHLALADRLVASAPELVTSTRRIFVDSSSWDAPGSRDGRSSPRPVARAWSSGCATATSGTSVRWRSASTPSDWSPSSGRRGANHSGASTNAFSPYWPSNPSRSIRASSD